MTRTQLVAIALRTVSDTSLTAEAAAALDIILEFVETINRWNFLQATTTYQTEDTVGSVAFSASKWPSAALTNFSASMEILSASAPYRLESVKKELYNAMNSGETGLPSHYALHLKTLYLWPTPVTGTLPLLTLEYYKNITLPTSDSDVIETVVGIDKKMLPMLINGVIWYMSREEGEEKSTQFLKAFYSSIISSILVDSNEDIVDDIGSIESTLPFNKFQYLIQLL